MGVCLVYIQLQAKKHCYTVLTMYIIYKSSLRVVLYTSSSLSLKENASQDFTALQALGQVVFVCH